MSQLSAIENAIKTSNISLDGLSKLPQTHLELILAFSFKYDNEDLFKEVFKIISFNNTSIKNKPHLLNWLISHNTNNEKNFSIILNKKITQYCLEQGIKFDLSFINKYLKEIDFYKTFKYCDNLSKQDFSTLFLEPIKTKQYQLLNQRIYDLLDYHQKYNKDIPLKFFENLCRFIIPHCIMAEQSNKTNKDLIESRQAIQEFIAYFSDKFDFFDAMPKNEFTKMTTSIFKNIPVIEIEKYYNTMRENILTLKLSMIDKKESIKPSKSKSKI